MSTSDKTLEEVYDEEISPLMTQIIAICKRAGIPCHASFALDEGLSCTTHIDPGEDNMPDEMESYDAWRERYDAAYVATKRESHSPMMVTTRNAAGEVTQMTAIAP